MIKKIFFNVLQGFITQRFVEETQALPLPNDNYPFCQYDSWNWGTDVNETLLIEELLIASKISKEEKEKEETKKEKERKDLK